MSLRLRLLLGLLAVTAVGLAVFALVSYGSLDAYLSDRVDDQVRSAADPAAVALLSTPAGKACAGENGGIPGDVPRGGPPDGGDPFPGGDAPGGVPGPGPDGSPEDLQLPPGTYAELRDAAGRRCASRTFGFPGSDIPQPQLPSDLEAVPPGEDLVLETVGSRDGGSASFRVTALRPENATGSIVVAVPTTEATSTLDRLAVIELIVAVAVLAALGFLAWWVIRLGLRPLERMGTTAGEIAAGDLSRRVEPANPSTEVGRLGLALNSMLEQIEAGYAEREASEARMRRFLSDASHELRTPLASIRGYAELFRLGAAERPEDLDKAMSRIEAESARMGVLVEDLLALARLDEVRELRREPVDLSALLSEAAADARVAAPDREITFDGPGSLTVSGDADQLRQVAGNLLRNAATHTPAGTPIELSLDSDGRFAGLAVRDHGPGLGDATGPELFERFWRASSDRGRASGGSGLGLAIVAAIVESHGGEVSAGNAPGGGAVFTARLPAA